MRIIYNIIIYRVYEPYHSQDENGTYEYGYFSTLKMAKERLEEVWMLKKYPNINIDKSDTGWRRYFCGEYDNYHIKIEKIEIDKKLNQ